MKSRLVHQKPSGLVDTPQSASIGQIVCPCHEGYFDPEDGSVLSGPPPTSLESLSVYIEDTTIFVSAGGDA